MSLTEEGAKHVDEIITHVFQYLKVTRSFLIPRYSHTYTYIEGLLFRGGLDYRIMCTHASPVQQLRSDHPSFHPPHSLCNLPSFPCVCVAGA